MTALSLLPRLSNDATGTKIWNRLVIAVDELRECIRRSQFFGEWIQNGGPKIDDDPIRVTNYGDLAACVCRLSAALREAGAQVAVFKWSTKCPEEHEAKDLFYMGEGTDYSWIERVLARLTAGDDWRWLDVRTHIEAFVGRVLDAVRPAGRVRRNQSRGWTQDDLDAAIQKYKAGRASTYRDIADGVKKGRKGARKSARTVFGRNSIAKVLKAPGAMVSKSPVWREIAKDLDLEKTARRQRIGYEMADEQQADSTKETVADIAVASETEQIIRSSMAKAEAAELIECFRSGKVSDDEARQIALLAKGQRTDGRSRRSLS